MKNKLIVGLVLFLSMFWIAGFTIFSFLPKDNSFHVFYPLLKMSYGRVCHQHLDKSFFVNGSFFLVCSRCTGIYVGSFIGLVTLLLPVKKYISSTFYYFVFFLVILLVDVITNNFIFASYNKTTAFFTGYLFSFFAVYFIIFELKRNNFFHTSQREI